MTTVTLHARSREVKHLTKVSEREKRLNYVLMKSKKNQHINGCESPIMEKYYEKKDPRVVLERIIKKVIQDGEING